MFSFNGRGSASGPSTASVGLLFAVPVPCRSLAPGAGCFPFPLSGDVWTSRRHLWRGRAGARPAFPFSGRSRLVYIRALPKPGTPGVEGTPQVRALFCRSRSGLEREQGTGTATGNTTGNGNRPPPAGLRRPSGVLLAGAVAALEGARPGPPAPRRGTAGPAREGAESAAQGRRRAAEPEWRTGPGIGACSAPIPGTVRAARGCSRPAPPTAQGRAEYPMPPPASPPLPSVGNTGWNTGGNSHEIAADTAAAPRTPVREAAKTKRKCVY